MAVVSDNKKITTTAIENNAGLEETMVGSLNRCNPGFFVYFLEEPADALGDCFIRILLHFDQGLLACC
jgi:hypothetical protein